MFDDEFDKNFEKHDVPKWVAESLKKIKYLFPKAHTAARAAAAIKTVWYKLHFPVEFYNAVLDNQVHYLKSDVITKGSEAVKAKIEELRGMADKGGEIDKEIELSAYLLVWELMSRGVEIPKRLSCC